MNSLFEYLNYRDYLCDFYHEKKKEHRFYSYRLFSQKAGFKSPNFLKLVIDGQRNLTKESVFKFCKALGLKKKECEYFENLVFFNQSKTLEEKNVYLNIMMKYRKKADPRKIERSEYEYYSAWYHPVIRELATSADFHDDFAKLAQATIPAITEAEARNSVNILCELGFVRRVKGTYVKAAASLSTGAQVASVAIANYHKAMMRLASESIERFGASQRDITSVTLNISSTTRQALVEKLAQFRRELLELAESDQNPDNVVQLNFQLFALSHTYPGKRKRS
ncbi:MAG: TIGR02147 family protein [Chitinivibrionales bacterium]|nr:TIGR02147 family protein [Chitinivibrionales bacterium]